MRESKSLVSSSELIQSTNSEQSIDGGRGGTRPSKDLHYFQNNVFKQTFGSVNARSIRAKLVLVVKAAPGQSKKLLTKAV